MGPPPQRRSTPVFLLPEGLVADEVETIRLRGRTGEVVDLKADEVEAAVVFTETAMATVRELPVLMRRALAAALEQAEEEDAADS